MPAVIDPNVCDRKFHNCFPARMCPESAFSQAEPDAEVIIDDALCGKCPGPCVNFCDQYAIRYTPDHQEFTLLKAMTLGHMSEAQAAEERSRILEAQKAKEAEEASVESSVVDVTAETFDEEVLQSEIPVIVDFWAPWCGPCKAFAPVFEKTAAAYKGSIKFVKVDTDAEQTLAMQFRIASIPTLGLFWNGRAVDLIPGAMQESTLQQLAQQFITVVEQHKQQSLVDDQRPEDPTTE